MDRFDALNQWRNTHAVAWRIALVGLFFVFLVGVFLGAGLVVQAIQAPELAGWRSLLTWLLAPANISLTWVITRTAGLVAYLLLWLSTVWGLAVSSRILEGRLHGAYTYDFHQFISLLAIGFLLLHLVMLLFDSYAPFSVAQLLVPLLSSYRPLWVAVGILAFYLVLLVTVTFYLRDRIGQAAFRTIHMLSLLAFVGAALHGMFAGTDTPLAIVKWMYAGSFLSVVFLTTYWMVLLGQKKLQAARR